MEFIEDIRFKLTGSKLLLAMRWIIPALCLLDVVMGLFWAMIAYTYSAMDIMLFANYALLACLVLCYTTLSLQFGSKGLAIGSALCAISTLLCFVPGGTVVGAYITTFRFAIYFLGMFIIAADPNVWSSMYRSLFRCLVLIIITQMMSIFNSHAFANIHSGIDYYLLTGGLTSLLGIVNGGALAWFWFSVLGKIANLNYSPFNKPSDAPLAECTLGNILTLYFGNKIYIVYIAGLIALTIAINLIL